MLCDLVINEPPLCEGGLTDHENVVEAQINVLVPLFQSSVFVAKELQIAPFWTLAIIPLLAL